MCKETKKCTRCKKDKELDEFRLRPTGFRLNQCRECENEMNKERRLKKQKPQVLVVKTKRGQEVMCSVTPIEGGRKISSPETDKVLYFENTVSRDTARVAFAAYAGISRTGMSYEKV